jgi:hypothetical protein
MGRLAVGDREALLLHLRRLTIGSRLAVVAPCEACGGLVDVSMSIDDLLQAPYGDWRAEYETALTLDDGASLSVRYRLPTGDDQTAVALTALYDLSAARHMLLSRCVLQTGEATTPQASVDDALARELPPLLSAMDPQAESLLDYTCPSCGAEGQLLLDAANLLFRELGIGRGSLYREVHTLASSYHWSEDAILALPWPKRQRYLSLLAQEVS